MLLCRSFINSPSNDIYRIFINWSVICCVNLLMGMTYFIETPLLHQYITSSSNQSDLNIEPGLGLGEEWYTAVISAGSVGVIVGALVFGLIAKHVYVKFGLAMELLVELLGGLLYAFSYNGWLVILSRLLNGFFIGFHQSLMRRYVVETCEKRMQSMSLMERKDSTLKYTVLFVCFCATVAGMGIGPVVAVFGAHIQLFHNEFQWPGYYICFHSFLLFLMVVFIFNDQWNDVIRTTVITQSVVPYSMLIVFMYMYLIFGWNMSIFETLQNPILSDQFGLNIEKTSFILMGILAVYLISAIITYIFQKFKVENRKILMGTILIGMSGTLIMTDWQSLGGDPCNQFSDCSINIAQEFGSSSLVFNYSHSAGCDGVAATLNLTECSYDASEGCFCELFSEVKGYSCFWNPNSRLTADYCNRCRPVCLSESHTLHFIQLLVGMVMLSYSYTPGRLLVMSIASDIAGPKPQGKLMGVLIACGAIARASGPFWGGYAYIAAEHRTWLPALIMFVVQLIAILLVLIVYRQMKRTVADDGHYRNHSDRELCDEEHSTSEDQINLLQTDNGNSSSNLGEDSV